MTSLEESDAGRQHQSIGSKFGFSRGCWTFAWDAGGAGNTGWRRHVWESEGRGPA